MDTTSHFEKSLQKIQFVINLCGLTFQSKKQSKKEILKIRCMYALDFLFLNTGLLGAIYWFVDGILTGKKFEELTFSAPCITFSFLCDLKSFYLIRYEDLVCDLIEDLRELEHKSTQNNKEKAEIRESEANFLHKILKASNLVNLMLLLTFSVSPFILMALKYIQTKKTELILPFLIKYPFDAFDIKYWPLAYVHQFWAVVVVIIHIIGPDYLLYVCCTYLRIQFRLLQYDIKNVIISNNMLSESEEALFEEKFVELVKWHQELIRLAELLELIYTKSTLFNFVSSSILICLTGFNVIAVQNVAFAVSFFVFLSTNLLQIFLLCYFGDLVMKSSMEIGDAVYDSKWYYINAKAGKNLKIVQTRAHKPCKLTAFGFSDVNLRAFMSILSSAWSYFALLKTVYTPTKN